MREKRKKNYLNGIDWSMNAIHKNSLKFTCSGNDFIIVMELEDVPAHEKLSSLLLKFVSKFPLLTGTTSRNFLNLAPYWKYNGNTVLDNFPIVVHDIIESAPAPVDVVVPAVEASSSGGGGGSSPAPVEDEEEVEESYSKIGIVSISSGAIVAVGNMSA